MPLNITVESHFEELEEEFYQKAHKAMETCGMIAEGYAKLLAPSPGKFGTGNLRNSISHAVNDMASFSVCYVGTNVPYAPYLELGTGEFAEGGGGSAPWVYTPDGGKHFYRTSGQPPKPFIKPSVADHEAEYNQIIEQTMKSG